MTATGAGQVVGITMEMQRLSANLTRQVAQFKIKKAGSDKMDINFVEEDDSPQE
jgi:hypothetical protein